MDGINIIYVCQLVGCMHVHTRFSLSRSCTYIYIYYWFHQIIFAGVCYTHPPPYSYREKRDICEKQDYFVIRCTAMKSSCEAESQFVMTRAEISFCRHQEHALSANMINAFLMFLNVLTACWLRWILFIDFLKSFLEFFYQQGRKFDSMPSLMSKLSTTSTLTEFFAP